MFINYLVHELFQLVAVYELALVHEFSEFMAVYGQPKVTNKVRFHEHNNFMKSWIFILSCLDFEILLELLICIVYVNLTLLWYFYCNRWPWKQ